MEQTERRRALVLLALSLGLGAVYRLYVAFTDDGIFWPDEIYQSLEPAHRLVYGYGLVPWEFIDGARNWALPGFVALLLKLSPSDPRIYLGVVRVAFVAIGIGTAWASYALARAYGAREFPAAVGAACFSLGALPLYFGHRAMSETAAALPVTLGLWVMLQRPGSGSAGVSVLLQRPESAAVTVPGTRSDSGSASGGRRVLIGASLLGLAVLLRLQCGVFAAGALAVLAARRDWQRLKLASVTLAVWALLFGLLDKLTWGDWFHSAIKYVEFNLVKGGGAAWGTHPWSHLVLHLFSSMTGLSCAFAVALAICWKHARGLALIAFAFFALHSIVPHKEIRFILTVLPLFGACVGVAVHAADDLGKKLLGPAVLLAALVSTFRAGALTFGELGAYDNRPQASAWDDFGPVNRLMLAAWRQPEVCGLRIDAAHLAWTGGSTYLHRDAPLYMPGTDPNARHFNYVITGAGSGAQAVAREGNLELVHIPVEPCAPDPGYTWRLP